MFMQLTAALGLSPKLPEKKELPTKKEVISIEKLITRPILTPRKIPKGNSSSLYIMNKKLGWILLGYMKSWELVRPSLRKIIVEHGDSFVCSIPFEEPPNMFSAIIITHNMPAVLSYLRLVLSKNNPICKGFVKFGKKDGFTFMGYLIDIEYYMKGGGEHLSKVWNNRGPYSMGISNRHDEVGVVFHIIRTGSL